jgi:hypothetical protein
VAGDGWGVVTGGQGGAAVHTCGERGGMERKSRGAQAAFLSQAERGYDGVWPCVLRKGRGLAAWRMAQL